MNVQFKLKLAAATLAIAAVYTPAHAADPLKIGLITTYSGIYAGYGKQMDAGIAIYMKQHGDTAGGRKILIIRRDDTGAAPELVKRLARELVINDKVDFLAGLTFTPNALATAPVATQSKTPIVIMNAATASIIKKSEFMVRTSFTLPQLTAPLARWAAAHGIKSVYIVVSDYAPGYEAEKAFQSTFTKAGGKIVGTVRIPFHNTDFSPYVKRVKDASPQAIFLFMPTGQPPVGFIRTFNEQGLAAAGVRVLATGGAGDDSVINMLGKDSLNAVTSTQYFPGLDNAENKAFVAEYHKLYGDKAEPDFYACDAYDGMAAIYAAANKLNGKLDGAKAIDAMKGLKLQSPRGVMEIDAKTRDIVQDIYIREVKMVNDHLSNVVIDTAHRIDDNGNPVAK